MADTYPFADIEAKWQARWQETRPFRAADLDGSRPKRYLLDMFPYPSGAGLHVGHPEGYTATDILARYRRMRGDNVLHPMGWDAFGLPAEQYAIETGTHPAQTTASNIATFRRQILRLGFSYDWDREINTTDPGYVKWTQWIFLTLYRRGLAYMASAPVWWCGACGTVLANEEVVDGRCERKGHPAERRQMRQWMLRITAYAERLLKDLDGLDWPEHIKDMQRNWIGRSEGAEVWFAVDGEPALPADALDGTRLRRRDGRTELKIFTTRPDTLFGATYMVLAPEHPLLDAVTTEARRSAVDAYRREVLAKSDLERTDLAKQKTGVATGAQAVNPVNGERIPIWIADYVLASYGTGAIMAVPAHDQRDLEFARTFGLPVRVVIVPEDRELEAGRLEQAYADPGRMHDSGPFSGLMSGEATGKITEWLASRGLGERAVNYKLRDWLFSRQRYWGEPIPVVHCDGCGTVPLPESALPLTLPAMSDFRPAGNEDPAPLARAEAWTRAACPACGGSARRETHTMPQWAGSCWYYLRYLDPKNDTAPWDPAKERYWMPVDLYVGGAEHAVLHLLYARFWHKVLYDEGLVSTPEPFRRLVNQGLILGEDGEKMSKSRGNVVNPDDVIAGYGADAFRLYEMFMGPLEAVKPWSTRNIEGVSRFLNRVWRLLAPGGAPVALADAPASGEMMRLQHETIKRVTDDLEGLRFNTALSALMTYVNALSDVRPLPRGAAETLLLLLAPFAPHLAEELWERLGHSGGLSSAPWPALDASALERSEFLLIVQVNGKVRARVTVPAAATDEELRRSVLADARVKKFLDGQPIRQFVIVPKRLVNIVV
ncbi:MAG TPA: leucine--tRNA ligase [bacterium]